MKQNFAKTIVNISEYNPTFHELALLSKGLTFCPRSNAPEDIDLLSDIFFFLRKIRLKHFFRNQDDLPLDPIDSLFKQSKGWTPPPGRNPQLDRFINCIIHETTQFKHTGNGTNLSKNELQALKSLRSNRDIVIKPSDKGGAIVIWGKVQYRQEADRQLSDKNFYHKVGRNNVTTITKEINTAVQEAFTEGAISLDQRNYLQVEEPRTPCFYMLPKIHKKGHPGRPIVSACGGPTSKLSSFLDAHLKLAVPRIPSYLKDTTHFLQRLDSLDLPTDFILATIDVTSLYTNIPTDEGIRACAESLSDIPTTVPLTTLLHFLSLTLNRNEFEFDGKFYRQIKGCAMGTPCAPNFANLFMQHIETMLLRDAPGPTPYIWWRFIDDVFIIWNHSRQELDDFLDYINSSHPSIKFTAEISESQVHFLDVTITKTDFGLQTAVYTKPTAAHLYLDYGSNHPSATKKAIPYSQALRIRKICSTDALFESQVSELTKFFLARGYPKRLLLQAVDKARQKDRATLLLPTTPTTSKKVVGVTTYGINNFPLMNILKKYSPILLRHPETEFIAQEGFLSATRQTPNLRAALVRSRFRSTSRRPKQWGSGPCGQNCMNCSNMIKTKTIKVTRTGQEYELHGTYDCNSYNLVYVITCKLCQKQYVGETKNKLKTRMAQHRFDIRHNDEFKPVACHFNSANHNVRHVNVAIIRNNTEWTNTQRKQCERAVIELFQSTIPFGLNIRE